MGLAKSVCLSALLLLAASAAKASATKCDEAAALASMAEAGSIRALDEGRASQTASHQGLFIYALRAFELEPSDQERADDLLAVMPQTDEAYSQLLVMGDVDIECGEGAVRTATVLSAIQDRAASDLAMAASIQTSAMARYLDYVDLTSSDPHSHAALDMRSVCLQRHKEWLAAVNAKPSEWRTWFIGHIMRSTDCTVLALPEPD